MARTDHAGAAGSDRLQEVPVRALDVARLEPIVGGERVERFAQTAAAMGAALDGRVVWNVNSTAAGGGVAEMLQSLLAYVRGAGVDARWLVIEGDPEFFAITKRVHNGLYGGEGDGGPLGAAERERYDAVTARNAAALAAVVRPGEVVIVHDPQPAGLVATAKRAGAVVVWRCHVGADAENEWTERAWAFLRPALAEVDAIVVSRPAFAPPWAAPERVHAIPPSIDPFSAKNAEIAPDDATHALIAAGLLAGHSGDGGADAAGSDAAGSGAAGADARSASADRAGARTADASDDAHLPFAHRDGSPGRVTCRADLVGTGPPPPADAPLVVQVSRWDGMKDMAGVMEGFAAHVDPALGAHLLLVGPAAAGVADDPEAAAVLDDCLRRREALPPAERERIHLACMPMEDPDEQAAVVDALQRHATVVVQKSLAEGFGLTVAEAMWKSRPVVASAVGGIQDQIDDGVNGVLLADPRDLAAFGAAVERLLADPAEARRLGDAARERVVDQFLGDRHLERWAGLLGTLVDR